MSSTVLNFVSKVPYSLNMTTIDIPRPTPQIDPERIDTLQRAWDEALVHVLTHLYPDIPLSSDPIKQLAYQSQTDFTRDPSKKPIVGIAGPGAAGKGTLGRYLIEDSRFTKVVNTTTREARVGEQDGIDYFFVNNEEFSATQRLGQFALHLLRPGRGQYGVTHAEIEDKLAQAESGCLLEENPENIIKLFAGLETTNAQKILLYVLPPSPLVETLLRNLRGRLSHEDDIAKRVLTPTIFESTLGDRQIDEFMALTGALAHPDMQVLFVINDDLETTKQTLSELLGEVTHE